MTPRLSVTAYRGRNDHGNSDVSPMFFFPPDLSMCHSSKKATFFFLRI